MRRLIALLAVLSPALVSAQPISSLDEETTFSALFEVAIWDPSESNPFDATKRMALSLLPAGGGGGGSSTFTGLTDTPAAITASQCVQGNGAGTALVFAACGSGGGSSTFIGLTDVPSAFVNSSFLRSTASALQFRTPAQVRSDIGANSASNLSTGTVADARIPSGIARDTELPSSNELVPTTGTTGHVLTKTATGRNWAAGGGGAADGVVTGGSVSGTSLTLERSVGADVVITGLPSGGTDPVVYRARVAADATDGVQEITLTTALEDGYLLAFDVDSGTGDTLAGRVVIPSTLLRALPAKATGPQVGDIDDGYSQALTRITLTSSLSQGLSNLTVWFKDDTHLWIVDSRQEMEGVAITGYPMAGGAAGGGGSSTFVGLTDTPSTITADDCVQGNATGTALVFGACGSGGGSTTFSGLTDTPSAFVNSSFPPLHVIGPAIQDPSSGAI